MWRNRHRQPVQPTMTELHVPSLTLSCLFCSQPGSVPARTVAISKHIARSYTIVLLQSNFIDPSCRQISSHLFQRIAIADATREEVPIILMEQLANWPCEVTDPVTGSTHHCNVGCGLYQLVWYLLHRSRTPTITTCYNCSGRSCF